MRAAVVLFPGLNSEAETVRTLELAGATVTSASHRDAALPEGVDLVVIPGGASYGDYLRPGAIAKTAPIMAAVEAHAARGGYVLGIGNGFQILTERGLLPGALTKNAHGLFECRDVFVRAVGDGPLSPAAGAVLRLPIAHGAGRYHAPAEVIAQLEAEGRIAFVYCDAAGEASEAANPNGAIANIAGVCGGPSKNVLGLMPHPERRSEPPLGGTDGLELFRAALRAHARPAA